MMPSVPLLDVAGICHSFVVNNAPVPVIDNLSCSVAGREFLSVVGPSGCGKSTLLRIMAGLLHPSSGTVRVNGRPIDGPPRELTYIFQQYTRALYPWLTVLANVEFGLRYGWFRGTASAERRRRSEAMLQAMDLHEFRSSYPWQLSGGMQQRVALARGLVCQPQMVLLDEPFSSVDAQTRASLQDLTLTLWRDYTLTALLVTHDIDEAVYLSSRVLVLSPRPTKIIASIDIDIPYPRTQIETRSNPRFIALRNHIHGVLFGGRGPDTPTAAKA